jgi:hypothetical protein
MTVLVFDVLLFSEVVLCPSIHRLYWALFFLRHIRYETLYCVFIKIKKTAGVLETDQGRFI